MDIQIPVFDIECVGWSTPISVGYFDGEEYFTFLKKDEDHDVMWEFLQHLRANARGLGLFAHYAHRYDNKFVLQSLLEHSEGVELVAGMTQLKWVEPGITFKDSYQLAPMSLEKLGTTLKHEAEALQELIREQAAKNGVILPKGTEAEQKGTWDHDAGLKPWEMGDRLELFQEYQKKDCTVLSQSISALCFLMLRTFGVDLKTSMANTAIAALKHNFYPTLDKVASNVEYEPYLREALYGGRNEVYKRYGENINMYDARSMFISCYDTPVPVSKMRWQKPNMDEGILAEAFVKVPRNLYIGPLPHRHHGKLAFPVGEFTGWWDMREIRHALGDGVDVTLKRQLTCDEETPILKKFGEYLTKIKTGDLEYYWKLFGNAIYGKFGQTRWRTVTRHITHLEDLTGYWPMEGDTQGEYWETQHYADTDKKAPYTKAAITMRIRAEARIRHHQYLREAMERSGEVYYCDTDSVFTNVQLPTGPNSGELRLIGTAERGYFIRQKLYAFVENGTLIQRSAGFHDLRLKEEDFRNLLEQKEVPYVHGDLPNWRKIFNEKDLQWIEKSRNLQAYTASNRTSVGYDSEPICLP